MGLRVTFDAGLLEYLDPAMSAEVIQALLRVLVQCNLEYLRQNPRTPHPYQSGAWYVKEKNGLEDWRDIPRILLNRGGDCEDLACYLAAWEQFRGVHAEPVVKWRTYPAGNTVFHIVVRYPNGYIEDPSKLLGMRGSA